MRCGAGDRCLEGHVDGDSLHDNTLNEQYDRYGIYAGRWHDVCWDKFGYGDFEFDASYAGESLEEQW